jgi:transposase-like protein
MNIWLQAIYLISSSKKGISSNQLHRTLGITLKTAWFMSHRIREAMRQDNLGSFGTGGGTVEVDETYIGRNNKSQVRRGYAHKQKVLSLVDRDTKQARSVVVDDVKVKTLAPILRANIAREAKLMTDSAHWYKSIGKEFASHDAVQHNIGEYVSLSNPTIHTNTIENYFSVFKRGMKGTYQHCGHNHLNRYLAEFDFRYNNRSALEVTDEERADNLLMGVVGKRLTYKISTQRI